MIYLLDFGLAKRYIDATTGKHIKHKNEKTLTGTARYASVNAHKGIEQSRRDDLESVCYILAYFLRGNVPWQGLQFEDRNNKYKEIARRKMSITMEELYEGFPIEFQTILN